jgi:hypothetical protein
MDSRDMEGTEERGDEFVTGCDMAAVLIGVLVGLLGCFRDV